MPRLARLFRWAIFCIREPQIRLATTNAQKSQLAHEVYSGHSPMILLKSPAVHSARTSCMLMMRLSVLSVRLGAWGARVVNTAESVNADWPLRLVINHI